MPAKIAIVGTGYVGLTTAVVLSEAGHSVLCVDKRPEIVEAIQKKRSLIYEPGLQEALARQSLQATTDLKRAVAESEVIFLCVGTPSKPSGEPDLTALQAAAQEIGASLLGGSTYKVIVVKSTVPPGTTDSLVKSLLEKHAKRKIGDQEADLGLAMVPEFLREGAALEDCRHPGRIVIGAENRRAQEILRNLFGDFEAEMIFTNARTAELSKYMTNTLLATLISFANELSNYGKDLGGIDFGKALTALSADPRWSTKEPRQKSEILSHLTPGCGFGGSCFPKDLKALISSTQKIGSSLTMLNEALRINECQAEKHVQWVEKFFPDGLRGKLFGICGLAFKPETDDVRETPAARIIDALLQRGAVVRAFDPLAKENYKQQYKHGDKIQFAKDAGELFEKSDGVFLVTPWSQALEAFYNPENLKRMRGALIIDCRGKLAAERMKKAPCRYLSPLIPDENRRESEL